MTEEVESKLAAVSVEDTKATEEKGSFSVPEKLTYTFSYYNGEQFGHGNPGAMPVNYAMPTPEEEGKDHKDTTFTESKEFVAGFTAGTQLLAGEDWWSYWDIVGDTFSNIFECLRGLEGPADAKLCTLVDKKDPLTLPEDIKAEVLADWKYNISAEKQKKNPYVVFVNDGSMGWVFYTSVDFLKGVKAFTTLSGEKPCVTDILFAGERVSVTETLAVL